MTDPFAYVPFAIAARGGSVDGVSAAQLTMAGVALLRSSAPLVRALHGRRSGILLPPSAGFFTALAASDGRAAVLLDPSSPPLEVARQLADANVGAVFTVRALAGALPTGTLHVLLDDAPARAIVVAGETVREIALTGHDALRLDGEADEPGALEPCAIFAASAADAGAAAVSATATHRDLLIAARATVRDLALHADDHVLALAPFTSRFAVMAGALAPLLAGARVTTVAHLDVHAVIDTIEQARVTHVVGAPADVDALLLALAHRALEAPGLRWGVSGGAALLAATQSAWRARTGTGLRGV